MSARRSLSAVGKGSEGADAGAVRPQHGVCLCECGQPVGRPRYVIRHLAEK